GLSSPIFGVTTSGGTCKLIGPSACYDGLITVSSVAPLFFRTGTILRTQYDFYSLVEHETDEILGTSSCGFNDCSRGHAPADFFRYHSNGTRAVAAGSNDACSAPSAANACFSIDATHMLQ